jgi:type II secretory pathway component PulM
MSATRPRSHQTDPISEAIASYERGDLPREQIRFGWMGVALCAVIGLMLLVHGQPLLAMVGLVGMWVSWLSVRQNRNELNELRGQL